MRTVVWPDGSIEAIANWEGALEDGARLATPEEQRDYDNALTLCDELSEQ